MKDEIIIVKKRGNDIFKVCISLILGGSILYWMYRDFNFKQVEQVLFHEMNWTWMLLSFPFGILAQAFRGWRWKLSLKPVGEQPRTSTALNSIFLSYAVSLAVPRIGEFARCVVLKRYDNVSFPKALGTVVTERVVDTLIIVLIAFITFVLHIPIFTKFFAQTGTSLDSFLSGFSLTGYIVTAICGISVLWLAYYLLHRLSIYNKVKDTLHGIWQGIISLKKVENAPLFLIMSLAIWVCYFLHHYLAFFCFEATSNLGFSCGLVTFIVGSFAVIVPTP
ncbi:MAG: flippase-like domain-containing protein, partial [Prevotella sp.]|nr:flippase-like domain-containing protein [Prevotella sp.]